MGRYTEELVMELQRVDKDNEYVIFLLKENFHECKIINANFSKHMVDVPWYSVREQMVMPREVKMAGVNLMHYPHWNVPIFSKVPFVVTIHDLILLEDEQSARATTRNSFVHGIKSIGHRIVLEVAIHRSKHIIAISEYTKRSILEHFRVKPGKISVVYNGIKSLAQLAQGVTADSSVEALAKTNRPSGNPRSPNSPFILSVGNFYPHKNLETTVMAFRELCNVDEKTVLVLAGKVDGFARKLQKFAEEIGVPAHRIQFVDTPSDAVLATLYTSASLLVIASRIEGFGIPPLEALALGVPVAASHAGSLPEVLGEHVRYFDPDDSDALARLMRDAVEKPELWKKFRVPGMRWVERYSWKKTALKMRDIYRNFADRRL